MTDEWTARLSEYLDGDVSASEQEALGAHLRECRECAAALAQLRAVTKRASALEDRPPVQDLWTGIARRIRAEARPVTSAARRARGVWAWRSRRLTLSMPQLLAAGIALMIISAGGVWTALSERSPPERVAPTFSPLVEVAPAIAVEAEMPGYGMAVAELERVLAEHRSELDSATVRVLEESLATIDRAIAEARAALAQDPANEYVNAHLAEILRHKLELLRRAARVASQAT